MVNLEWYRTFKYVYDFGSLTIASQKLFMSQPGVGKQIIALESQIGKKLFHRTGRKLLPTEYAKFLYTQVNTYIEGLERAEQKFKRGSSKGCPSIVVGCSYDLFNEFISKKVLDINMYITFKLGTPKELIDFLEKDKIHLMFSDSQYSDYNHSFEKIWKGSLKLYASGEIKQQNPFQRITKTNSKEFQKWLSTQQWITYDNELTYINEFWKSNFNTKPNIMAKYVIASFSSIASSLQKGNGLALLPTYISENTENKKSLKEMLFTDFSLNYELFLAYKKNSEYTYEINLLTNYLNIKQDQNVE